MDLPKEDPALRKLLAEGEWAGGGFFTAAQDIGSGVEWAIRRNMDTVVVHLGGPIHNLETELDGRESRFDSPMPGEIWVIPEDTGYVTRARGGTVWYTELRFSRAAVNQLAGKPVVAESPRERIGQFDAFLHQAALRLKSLSCRDDDVARLAASSLFESLALDFYSRFGEDGRNLARACRQIRMTPTESTALRDYIASHLGASLRLETLAAQVSMTTHELLIAFRAAFGVTPAQYVIEQRLRLARRLLLTTRKSVADIAYETGFSSHAHLASSFRKRLDVSPDEFRRAPTSHSVVAENLKGISPAF